MHTDIDWQQAYRHISDTQSQQSLYDRITAGHQSLAAGMTRHMQAADHGVAMLRAIVNMTVGNASVCRHVMLMMRDAGHYVLCGEYWRCVMADVDGKRLFVHLVVNVANQVESLGMGVGEGGRGFSGEEGKGSGAGDQEEFKNAFDYCVDQSIGYFFDAEHIIDHDILQTLEKNKPVDEKLKERAEKVIKNKVALERYDEWMYILIDGILECKFTISEKSQSQLEKLIKVIQPSIDTQNIHLKPIPPRLLHLLEYIFHLLQKTVEYKIHYSVIREIEVTSLDKDDFYSASKSKDKVGIRIGIDDFHYIKQSLEKSIDDFMSLPGTTESSDHLVYIHILIKLLIPISFIGGYNAQVQKVLVPETLGKLAKLIEFIHANYYRPKVPVHKEAVYCLNTNIVRLVGNLVHVNKEAQDYLMANDMVAPLLKYTLPDGNNPLSRESSIVFIRYMSESNPEAAQYIKSKNVFDLESDTNKLFTKETFM